MIRQILLILISLLALELYAQNTDATIASLRIMLDSAYDSDQRNRRELHKTVARYGWDSEEIKLLHQKMAAQDSLNLILVKETLNKHGWLGAGDIGEKANMAIFLVVQHADSATQATYLPLMRDAVAKGNARAENLALLEDRVALQQKGMQIYGSQIGIDESTGLSYVLPLDDPDHVDARREKMGLEPMRKYVADWGIRWNVKEYKKSLPYLRKKK